MRITIPGDHLDPSAVVGNYFAPEIVKANKTFSQAVYQNSQLPLRVFEGARARTAEINGCTVCRAFRAKRDLPGFYRAQGIDASRTVINNGEEPDENFYQNVSNWETYPGFSERERIAIEYAERFCLDPQNLAKDEDFWTRMQGAFADDEIVDLSYSIASFVASGRVAHVLGLDTVCIISQVDNKG